MANITFDGEGRSPWNNVIYPGNYVADLNAYRKQGVTAIPGVNFFRVVGAYVVDEADLNASGELANGSYEVSVLSPDLRQDDKPRRDYRMVVPEGASAYRIGISTLNLKGTGGSNIEITPDPLVTSGLDSPTLADDSAGVFPESGEFTAFAGLGSLTAQTGDALVSAVVAGGALTRIDADSQAAIIVEVCFIMDAPAPDSDQLHLPYKVEAGSGT